ncbi:MAG: N-formylglutamate amidohydrolase [Alphaproteobacteria bacterium]|nr:N-formylglutamate amidohydrolase [Alphaproteobacteria bacterium]
MSEDRIVSAFEVRQVGKDNGPMLISSPHSGVFYPKRLFQLSKLSLSDFRKMEDAQVDQLFSFAPSMGIPLISGQYGRAWVDLNRGPLELDPVMFQDELPKQASTDTKHVLAGFGVIPSKVSADVMIYDKMLDWEEEQNRVSEVHVPYHKKLGSMISENIRKYGYSMLWDVHSMPRTPEKYWLRGKEPDIVIGTNDGKSCDNIYAMVLFEMFVDAGFVVTVNTPYSGAYTTLRYGVPEKHSHVIQIEIARSLYWDVNNYLPLDNFNHLSLQLSTITANFYKFVKEYGS